MRASGWISPTVALTAVFVIGNVGWAVAEAYSAPLPAAFLSLYYVGVPWALAWWVVADCRQHGFPTSIDHGWFVFFAWPVMVPYHLIQTRRARGCLIMAGMLGLFAASWGVALVVYFVLSR